MLLKYNQAFVDAVRATGGNNANRTLVVQGPATNIASACESYFTLPTDVADKRMMVEVHFYDPWNFCLLSDDNAVWFWGEGKRPNLDKFTEKYGIKGSVVSAVDLIRGIGRLSGMNVAAVDGATGYIDTNFNGKANAAIEEFKKGQDFVFVHLEAPDECGHRGEPENKVRAIELIDEKILAPVAEYLKSTGEHYRVLVMPDHPTPIAVKTHTSTPVPFMIYDSKIQHNGVKFTEDDAKSTGIYIADSRELMPRFLNK